MGEERRNASHPLEESGWQKPVSPTSLAPPQGPPPPPPKTPPPSPPPNKEKK